MSSEYQQVRVPLRRVALYGGGRWSRVLVPVIQSLLDENAEIVWVTKNGYDQANRWLIEKTIERVSVQSHVDLGTTAIDAAVVATTPATHGRQVFELLEHGIPTFCEKPFTLDFDEAVRLHQIASAARCPLGVNLEMYFASFVEDFAALVLGRRIRTIEITWLDPWLESRYGDIKHGDIYTNIVDDMWPHCWSLLRRLCPGCNVEWVDEVRYEPNNGCVYISVRIHDVVVSVVLSRRSDRRVRLIEVNSGDAVLDFSTEPGSTKIDGTVSMNQWRGLRPLSRSLSSFFEVIFEPKLLSDWALSGCLDAVRSAEVIGDQLRKLQQVRLAGLRDTGVQLADEGVRNLIVDLLLPKYASQDRRWPAITIEDQIAFVRHICTTQRIGCN